VPIRQHRQPGTCCRIEAAEKSAEKDYAMSLAVRSAERTTLKRLLELALKQVSTLEADDLPAFDAILSEKRTLTKSLKNGPAILAADPSLETLVVRIQDADKAAQRVLYQKVGLVMREINRVNRQEQARGAYYQAPSAAPKPVGFLPDTPMFMDVRS